MRILIQGSYIGDSGGDNIRIGQDCELTLVNSVVEKAGRHNIHVEPQAKGPEVAHDLTAFGRDVGSGIVSNISSAALLAALGGIRGLFT
jgi:hypothetical protein